MVDDVAEEMRPRELPSAARRVALHHEEPLARADEEQQARRGAHLARGGRFARHRQLLQLYLTIRLSIDRRAARCQARVLPQPRAFRYQSRICSPFQCSTSGWRLTYS